MNNFLSFIFLIGFLQLFAQKPEKMEPPFWWSDMLHSDVQLMLYGKNIAQYDVKINAGTITQVLKTENPNYLFVDWNTAHLKAGNYQIQFFLNNKLVFTQNYELKSRRENSRYRKGFDSSDAVYLIMSDRFANGNSNNDSTTETTEKADRNFDSGRHGGDIDGIINHLDYLQALGVTALWCTPMLEDNEIRYSYHGYAISDCFKIDSRFGTNEDFKKLSYELHQKGMKHIMDYVTNHWGGKHWMIQDLPTYDWIHHWENADNNFQRSNYRMTTQFDPNATEIDKKGCMDGWFDTTMPDMNQSNPLLLKYITQNAIWWIEYADLDGLRVDTYSYNDKDGISQWTKAIMDEYPNFNIVGEVWMHDQAQISYWQKDSPIGAIENYNSYLPSVMDFTLHDALEKAFNEDKMNWADGMVRIYENFTNDFLYANPNNLMLFMGNHDTSRFISLIDSDINKYKMGLTLISTARGYPQLYYGEEIAMTGLKSEGDGLLRKDFPGGWKEDLLNAFSSQGRNEKQTEFYEFTKKILNWRKTAEVVHHGKMLHFVPGDNVYVYFRYTDDKSVMVVINNSDKSQKLKWELYAEGLKNYNSGKDIFSDKNYKVNEALELTPKTSLILELSK
jgi:glycosidase